MPLFEATGGLSKDYTAHVVYKLNMSIPYDAIIGEDVEYQKSEIHIKEKYSTPIINNDSLLKELFDKF